jgi:hypothetical protein
MKMETLHRFKDTGLCIDLGLPVYIKLGCAEFLALGLACQGRLPFEQCRFIRSLVIGVLRAVC